jgi:redox-sensing transcriptional repressor
MYRYYLYMPQQSQHVKHLFLSAFVLQNINWFVYYARMSSLKRNISPSMVKRLPRYFSRVQTLANNGIEWVSSIELARDLGLTSSTVRQDFSCFSFSGVSKRGYEVQGLLQMLADILGADNVWKVVVVGAGNLGRALVLHEDFRRNGFNIMAIFDSDTNKHGTKIGSLEVLPMSELNRVVKEGSIDMGIIAVPDSAAQSVADLLVNSGIKGILNMAMTHITTPDRISVTDSRIVASLQQLSHCVLFSCRRNSS